MSEADPTPLDCMQRIKFLEGAVMILSRRLEQAVRALERQTGARCELEWKELRAFPDGLRYQSTTSEDPC